jgi:hypothetical protein
VLVMIGGLVAAAVLLLAAAGRRAPMIRPDGSGPAQTLVAIGLAVLLAVVLLLLAARLGLL